MQVKFLFCSIEQTDRGPHVLSAILNLVQNHPPAWFVIQLARNPEFFARRFEREGLVAECPERVRTSRNRAEGQCFTLPLFFLRSTIGARVEWIIDVLLFSALMTMRGKNLFARTELSFGFRHWDGMRDLPPFLASSCSSSEPLRPAWPLGQATLSISVHP